MRNLEYLTKDLASFGSDKLRSLISRSSSTEVTLDMSISLNPSLPQLPFNFQDVLIQLPYKEKCIVFITSFIWKLSGELGKLIIMPLHCLGIFNVAIVLVCICQVLEKLDTLYYTKKQLLLAVIKMLQNHKKYKLTMIL